MDDPFAETRKLIAEWDAQHAVRNGPRNPPIDLVALANMDFNYEWLVEQFWPMGGHVHVFASPKTGKSLLMLWVAANIAIGRDPFTLHPMKRYRVTYVDNEMTLKDLRDRLADMGFDFAELAGWLMYHPYPALAPMDTPTGGTETLEMMNDDDSKVLILDTLSRVVKGEENSNDTYRNFYNYTGRLLKANDIAMCRLDHAGHDPKKSRGASAKADDVDLVYGLTKGADKDQAPGFTLERTHSRIGGIPERFVLSMADDPIVIKSARAVMWSAQAIAKAKELSGINVPIDASQREAIRMLREAGYPPGKTMYLAEAMRLRKSTETIDGFLGL